MRKRISQKELSAYLDGEATDPSRIEAALAASETLQCQLESLSRVSARVQSLESQAPRMGFAKRVVAHLHDEPETMRAGSRGSGVGWSVATAVAALALVIAVAVGTRSMDRAVEQPVATAPATVEVDDAAAEARLMAELERRVASDETVQRIVTARFDASPAPEDLYTRRLLAAVANYGDMAHAGDAAGFVRDYRPALRSLDAAQTTELKRALAQSVAEGLEG